MLYSPLPTEAVNDPQQLQLSLQDTNTGAGASGTKSHKIVVENREYDLKELVEIVRSLVGIDDRLAAFGYTLNLRESGKSAVNNNNQQSNFGLLSEFDFEQRRSAVKEASVNCNNYKFIKSNFLK